MYRYLATGDDQKTIANIYRLGRSTVHNIIMSTCQVLFDVLQQKYMKPPVTEVWKIIANFFWDLWNFPNCIGAIDGKHVRIRAPFSSGTEFYNYKGFYSIVLLLVADGQYGIIFMDVGDMGHNSDCGIFRRSPIGKGFA